jgi:hypothetical protein
VRDGGGDALIQLMPVPDGFDEGFVNVLRQLFGHHFLAERVAAEIFRSFASVADLARDALADFADGPQPALII